MAPLLNEPIYILCVNYSSMFTMAAFGVLVTMYCKVVVLNHRKYVSPDNVVLDITRTNNLVNISCGQVVFYRCSVIVLLPRWLASHASTVCLSSVNRASCCPARFQLCSPIGHIIPWRQLVFRLAKNKELNRTRTDQILAGPCIL